MSTYTVRANLYVINCNLCNILYYGYNHVVPVTLIKRRGKERERDRE